jgi:cell division transport system ATP-binding protein
MIVPGWSARSSVYKRIATRDLDPVQDAAGRGAIRLVGASAGYGKETILRDVSISIRRNEFVFVEGPSGAGKTTFLKLLYGTLRPQSGMAVVDGVDLSRLGRRLVPSLRRRLGCVFQSYELLRHLTALENVILPLELAHSHIRRPRERAADALELVGLGDKLHARPQELSGGQQQRVAIARAIAHEPRILLADEPTGNLDPVSTTEVMDAFETFHARGGTVVMATHDEALRDRYAKRVLRILPRAA